MKEKYSNYKGHKTLKIIMMTITTLLLSVSAFTFGGVIRRAQWSSEKRKAFENFFIGGLGQNVGPHGLQTLVSLS